MDEIEYKLKTSNSVLVVNGIEKLITNIKCKFKPSEKHMFAIDNEELKFLFEKCSSKEKVISLTACQALLTLVETGILQIGQTMSTLISLLSTAHDYSGIVSTMGGLLTMDLRSQLVVGQPYVCQFSLKSPQHPFITVLEKNSDTMKDVLAQMQVLCAHPDKLIADNSLELFRAVFLWLTCSPRRACCDSSWQLLLSLKKQSPLLLECLSWQVTNPTLIESAVNGFLAVMNTVIYQDQKEYIVALVPVLCRISKIIIDYEHDPRPCYNVLDRCFSLELPELRATVGISILLLAENLMNSPALYLHGLFNLCLKIINKFDCPSISLNAFIALSLQWLHYPSYLTSEALKTANKILSLYQSSDTFNNKLYMSNLQANTVFQTLIHIDSSLTFNFHMLRTWERIGDNEENIKIFDNIQKVDEITKLKAIPFLFGVFLEKNVEDWFEKFIFKAFNLILGLVTKKNDLAVSALPIILFKIANSSSPEIQLECFRAIPRMAKIKENVPTIVTILNRIKSSKGVPTSFLIMLFTNLVEVQSRCYPYLQELLADNTVSAPETDLKWEIDIAKAVAVKKTCQTRAAAYGRELVSFISSILNRCTDGQGAVASATALEGLRVLWHEHIVSPPSTWYALAPKLGKDKRIPVQLSLCKLLGDAPHLRVQTPDYDKFICDAAKRLWCYIAESNQPEVITVACKSLANYKLEDYNLKVVPEIYRKNIKLPPSYCKTPADAARNPVDVLDYIPFEIWPNVFMLTNHSATSGVRQLIVGLMEREIQSYRSGVYRPDEGTRGEPTSLHHLPPHSVVRGLMEYVRKQATSPSYDCPDTVFLEMLQCLSHDFGRPLPPLDLCFLHDLFHRGRHLRYQCLLLGARQALISGSAKRFIENYLTSFKPEDGEESDIIMLFQLLPHLSRSIPPNALRAPVEKCLDYAHYKIADVKVKDDSKNVLFVKQMDLIKECLEDNKIHEANRTLLSQIIENYLSVISDNSVAWESYIRCCCLLSSKHLERMTSPSSWWEVTGELIRKAGSIRSALAARPDTNAPLTWLNDIIDATVTCPIEYSYILRQMVPSLLSAPNDKATLDWLLQLMARAQTIFAEYKDENSAEFLCDMFMLSVVVISGIWCSQPNGTEDVLVSRELRCDLFPAAVAFLISEERSNEWQDCATQLVEWLHHTRFNVAVPTVHRVACHRALIALRNCQYFTDPKVWPRIIGYKQNYTD